MKAYILLSIVIIISMCSCRTTDFIYASGAEDKTEISLPQFEENFGKQVLQAKEHVRKYESLLEKYQQGWTEALDQRDEAQQQLQAKAKEAKDIETKLTDAIRDLRTTRSALQYSNSERDRYAAEMMKYQNLWERSVPNH